MKRVMLKQHLSDHEWMWKFLCIVFDNEALGLLERCLASAGWEFKIEDMP